MSGRIKLILATLTVTLALIATTNGNGSAKGWGSKGQMRNSSTQISQLPRQDIDPGEQAGLIKMREEEKLARDVYLSLYDKWHHRIFKKIAASEQKHMDAVKLLLDKYGINDPVTNNDRGKFSNPEVTKLYEDLVDKGSKSLTEALLVGATIEDLDIYDLNNLLKQTDNQDIQLVYEGLKRGSENHMRAFSKVLAAQGITYKAQYLSQEEINQILEASPGKGKKRGRGRNKNW